MTASVSQRLAGLLQARGAAWPAGIEHFESLGSTNDRLKEGFRSGWPAWSVVLADRQTAGRGRHGRVWVSPAGNLYLSVLLPPPPAPELAGLVPLTAGIGVAEAVGRFGVEGRLKWPNDVEVGGRKLAGILAEGLGAGGGTLEAVVLGVGVNVAPAGVPVELAERATSLGLESGADVETVEVAAEVLARLALWYHALAREGASHVLSAWRARSVPWWGRTVEVRSGDDVVRGVARDVDERGALLVDVGGSLIAVLSGEAREVRLK